MDGQSARLLAGRVVILLFLVAFIDSIERFLYVGISSGTSTDLLSFVSSGLIDLRRGEACYRIVRDANVISYSITGA